MNRGVRKVFMVLLLMAILPVLSLAQVFYGAIYGRVSFEDGAIIPGMMCSLSGEGIGKRTTITSVTGHFRFGGLPPGTYDLNCDISGCTCSKKDIEIHAGETVMVNIICQTGTNAAAVKLIGSRKMRLGMNLDEAFIRSIPTARNPWTLLTTVPGMMLDRVDIGGADSGQQSDFLGFGSDQDDTTWYMDGANITDPSAIGSAPAYLNVNSYAELQVTVGANDIAAQTGGIQLNFLTHRPGNKVSGDFHLYVEDDAWEMKQDPTQYMVENGLVVPGIQRLHQYGVNIGGPIIKNKLWWFGSYAVQDIHKRTEAQIEDATWLVSFYGKLNFQLGNTSGDCRLSYDAKNKSGRTFLSPVQQDVNSLWDQEGPGYIFYGNLFHIFGDLTLNLKATYTDGGFSLKPRGADINPQTGHSEGNDFKIIDGWTRIEGSAWDYNTNRNAFNMALAGNYFLENALGGDHEIRFGVDYFNADTTTQSLTPNQRILYIYRDNPAWNYMAIVPDYLLDVNFKRLSAYIQDTITWGKLTAFIGLRYDREQGKVNPITMPYFTWYEPGSPHHGERMFADVIHTLEIREFKVPAEWELLSPRISLTYDITGNGKNMLKLSAARYMSQSGNSMAVHYIPFRSLLVNWADTNGDETPQFEEVGDIFYGVPFYQIDPITNMNRVQYDGDYNTPYLDELILMFEKALTSDLAFSIAGFYKKRHNLSQDVNSRGEMRDVSKGIMSDGSIETKENWAYMGTALVGGTEVPIYEALEAPVGNYYYNLEKAYDRYLGLQLLMTKKLSHGWMANLSFTLQDWKRFRFEEETLDMNNFDFFNQGVVAPSITGSGLRDIWINSGWMVKLTGMYQLPWGINLTAFFQAREGYPQPLRRRIFLNQGGVYLYRAGKKSGNERLPFFWLLNLGLEKTLDITDTITATLLVDWYNVTNNQIELKHNLNIGAAAGPANPEPIMWTNPGIFQLGIRLNF